MKVSNYFDKQIKPVLNAALAKAQESIEIAVTWFTDKELFSTLCEAARCGVRVELIVANHQINYDSAIRYEELSEAGGQVFFIGESDKNSPLMHLKFCIIDNNILITGSYNYTYKAQINHENIIISEEDYKSILDFHTKFTNLKRELSKRIKTTHINTDQQPIPFVQYQRYSDATKWGFCDENKIVVIPLIYDEVRPFSEGLAAIKKDELWGFINHQGQKIVNCQYVQVNDFKEGMAAVCKSKTNISHPGQFTEWGFVNISGKTIVECQYDKVQDFNEGYGLVSSIYSVKESYEEVSEHFVGYPNIEYIYYYSHNLIDKQGVLFAKHVDSAISDGFYLSTSKKENPYPEHTREIYERREAEYGFYDWDYYNTNSDDTWLEVIEYKGLKNPSIDVPEKFNITIYEQFGLNAKSVTCYPFSEGFGLIEFFDSNADDDKSTTFFFIDKNENVSVPFTEYHNVYPMKNGLIRVVKDYSYSELDLYEDRFKEETFKNWVGDYRVGFVDIYNQNVVPIDYKDAGDFHEGVARVKKEIYCVRDKN